MPPQSPCSFTTIHSPLGELLVVWQAGRLLKIQFDGVGSDAWRHEQEAPFGLREQLASYFAGELRSFDLPLAPEGTSFQQKVWAELQRIPYGVTMTYGELAYAIGQPTASRAVGGANNRNPLPIVIPCHRVIGARGRLIGYAGGLEIKVKLIELERRVLARVTTPQPSGGDR